MQRGGESPLFTAERGERVRSMEKIYRGTAFAASIQSSVLLTRAVLFNRATKTHITATLETAEAVDNGRVYNMKIAMADTKTAAVGVYDLEMYSGSETYNSLQMEKHITNYARVVDTSAAN